MREWNPLDYPPGYERDADRIRREEQHLRVMTRIATQTIETGQTRAWAEWGRRIGEFYWIWAAVPSSSDRFRDESEVWDLYANDLELDQLKREYAEMRFRAGMPPL